MTSPLLDPSLEQLCSDLERRRQPLFDEAAATIRRLARQVSSSDHIADLAVKGREESLTDLNNKIKELQRQLDARSARAPRNDITRVPLPSIAESVPDDGVKSALPEATRRSTTTEPINRIPRLAEDTTRTNVPTDARPTGRGLGFLRSAR